MSKQNAEVLARTARSEAERITNGDKRTIAAIINNWNECVKQSGFWCIYDFPTTGYTRKSQLVADLLRCAVQLDEYVEPNPHAAQTVKQQTREFNASLTRVLDVEEAHAEALDINAWIDDLTQNGVESKRLDIFCFQVREDDHAEALEMNVGIELALHIITKMGGSEGAGDAAGGCLYRDGFNEINYLVSVALGIHEKRETDHAEAIEEDKRYTWLANRWGLFWGGVMTSPAAR